MQKSKRQPIWPVLVSFLVPIILMGSYFIFRKMAPFGNNSILTIDSGQQYIDFFAYFRHTLFKNGLFYSFSKALGGETLGTWAYYLMSPLNLLLLALPVKLLPSGVLFITVLKYGLAGLAFSILLRYTIKLNPNFNALFSIAYALNGWIIANQLDVMWLDSMFWLPLIFLGLQQIIHGKRSWLYAIALTFAIISNYYMSYMILLFMAMYVFYRICVSLYKFSHSVKFLVRVGTQTLLSLCLTAWLTLPTWFSLKQGKASYLNLHFKFRFEYTPVKMFVKFFLGCLNFKQIPRGTPNIFIGSVAMIGALMFLFCKQIRKRVRVGALMVTLFMILSMCYVPLDLLWHAGQYPVWYPYRFSYIFCFWIIWLAANAVSKITRHDWTAISITWGLLVILIAFALATNENYNFLSVRHILMGTAFLVVSSAALFFKNKSTGWVSLGLLLLTIIEMSLNASLGLNKITFISNPSYVNYTHNIQAGLNSFHYYQHPHHYRIGKSFNRSRDDSFTNDTSDGDTFDSSLTDETCLFMEHIGEPETPRYTTYADGNLISDRLLGYRIYMSAHNLRYSRRLSTRSDVDYYPIIHNLDHLTIRKNPSALPEVYPVTSHAFHLQLSRNPLIYEARWYHAVTGKHAGIKPAKLKLTSVTDVSTNGKRFEPYSQKNPGSVRYKFKPKPNNVYYLRVTNELSDKHCKVRQGPRVLTPGTSFQHNILVNPSTHQINRGAVRIKLKLSHTLSFARRPKLFRMNARKFMNNPYRPQAKILHQSNEHIRGEFISNDDHPDFGSTIPATSGWQLSIDGHPARIHKIAGEFIGAKAKPGPHTFELSYHPPFLKLGAWISIATLLAWLIPLGIDLTHRFKK